MNFFFKKLFSVKNTVGAIMLGAGLFFFTTPSLAAPLLPAGSDASYQGKYVSQSIADPIEIMAGETKTVNVKIKNTGKVAWQATGKNFVSLYTINPKYRESVFYTALWRSKTSPAQLRATVNPGEVADFNISITAPEKTGIYQEDFFLAAENKTWIKGTYFFFKIKVVEKTITQTSLPPTTGVQIASNAALPPSVQNQFIPSTNIMSALAAYSVAGDYLALPISVSEQTIQKKGNEEVGFQIRYLNSGKKSWNGYAWRLVEVIDSRTGIGVSIKNTDWVSDNIVMNTNQIIGPGDFADVAFRFKTPPNEGKYTLRFELTSGNQSLVGGRLEIPVIISESAVVMPSVADVPSPFSSSRTLVSEPLIRVGLYKTDQEVRFVSDFPYKVYSGVDEVKGILNPGETATLSYTAGIYGFKGGGIDFTSSNYIRLVPNDLNNYFTLVNYDRTVSWKGNKNFNIYRGTLEYKYSPKSGAPYVIEEVPLDSYVAGIAETSDNSAPEYIKAVLIAARTYAYINIDTTTPLQQRSFDVYPTTVDQLYLGYLSETMMPKVVNNAKETFGQMVTYQGNPVTTPYFGNSDGMTRTSKEVWGGVDKPWLQPVEAVYDKGKKMWGHGVGMSTQDALQRATKDGWTYEQLLKHYYTGVEIEKIY
jgi:hypothetical protein